MAPPGLKVQKYEECLKPASYGRLLRLQISFLKEEEKIATLMNCLPKRWMDKLYRELLEEESEDYKLTSDYILKYVDKCVTEENKMTSIAVSIAKTFRIKFESKKNAMSSFLEELIRSAKVIHSNKTVTETIAVMFFIQGISSKCKEDLITNNKLPTLAECREFALEKDLRYDERSFFNEGKDMRTNQTNFRMYEGSKSKELVKDNKKMVEKEKTENDDRKTELLSKQIKFQSVSNTCEATISIAQCKLDGLEESIGFGMDSCASYCTIPTEIFNKFSPELKEQYKNNRNEDVLLTSIHETTSITDGYIDTYITISGCPKIIEKRKIRLFIDPKSKLPLISFNFMCDNDSDPRWFRKEYDCSNKSNKNLVGKYGITYGEFSKKFEEFLDEDKSRILWDPSMIIENKITVELKVNDKYTPRRMHIIPVPIDLQKEVKEILDDEVSRGWLTKLKDNEKVDNTSPLIVVKRAGKSPRLCYSMLHVNKFIENPIMESLPSAKDLLLENNIELISLFDIRSAYRSISLSNKSKEFCIIATQWGLYRSNSLTFGCKASPSLFYNEIRKILKGLECYVKVYVDDIINHAPRNIHEDINIEICRRLRSYNFRLATDKCYINVTSGIFLGMNFDIKKGLSIPAERLEAILNLPSPSNNKELKSITAKIRFYGDNIPGFPLYAQNIYKMIDKKPFDKERVNLEFKSLLEKTAKAITLECIDKSCISITIVVAAKDESLAYIILCNYESIKKPIMVGSRQLRTHEKNYKESTKIILALREAIYSNLEICSRYEIICKSNVKGLEKSNGIIPLTAFNTHQRLLVELSPFQIKFQFTDTNKDLVSEFCNTKFSRSTTVIEESYQAVEIAELLPFSSSELKESYKNDKDVNLILDMLLDVKTKEEIKMKLASSFRKFLDTIELVNEIIFINKKLFITRELSSKLMLFLHKEHDSAYAMKLKANKYYIMAVNNCLAKEIYESCNICNNLRRNKTRTVDSWPSTDSSHERFHADVGEINKTKFLCITDVHSGFIMVENLKTEKSLEIINKYRTIFRLYGKPTLLVSDNARYFCAEETIHFLESINVCHIFAIPRCPQSNGYGEKSVGLVKLKAQKLIDDGMKTTEAVEKAAIILQDRITKNDKTAKEIFFGIEINIKDVLEKHNFKPKPMSVECLFKVDRSDKQWRAGIAIEQVGRNIFRIESQGRIFIRKLDSINFTKEGRRIVNIDKIWCKDNEVMSSKSTEMPLNYISNNVDESCQVRESLERNDTLNNFDESLQFSKTLEKDNLLGLTHTVEQENIDLNQYCMETEEEYQQFMKNGEFKIECGIDGSAYQGVGSAFVLKSGYYNINTVSGMKGNSNDSAQQAEVTALTLALEEIHRLAYSKTIPKNEPILIATDSDYVFKTVRIYFKEWESRGFKKANNETPAFLEKWKGIFKRLKQINATFIKVRAHAGIIINCEADTAARKYASATRVLRSQM